MAQSNIPPVVGYAAARGAKAGARASYAVAKRIPWWGWGIILAGGAFGLHWLLGQAKKAVTDIPSEFLKAGEQTAKQMVGASARFMKYTFDTMVDVAKHIAQGLQSLLSLETEFSVAKANEEFFNNLNPTQTRATFRKLWDEYQSHGYTTTLDWRSICIFMKQQRDLQSIGKGFNMIAAGEWPLITSMYDMVQKGDIPVVAPYDLIIGELARNTRRSGQISAEDMTKLAGVIERGKKDQAQSKNILISQKGLALANDLNAAVQMDEIKVVE